LLELLPQGRDLGLLGLVHHFQVAPLLHEDDLLVLEGLELPREVFRERTALPQVRLRLLELRLERGERVGRAAQSGFFLLSQGVRFALAVAHGVGEGFGALARRIQSGDLRSQLLLESGHGVLEALARGLEGAALCDQSGFARFGRCQLLGPLA